MIKKFRYLLLMLIIAVPLMGQAQSRRSTKAQKAADKTKIKQLKNEKKGIKKGKKQHLKLQDKAVRKRMKRNARINDRGNKRRNKTSKRSIFKRN